VTVWNEVVVGWRGAGKDKRPSWARTSLWRKYRSCQQYQKAALLLHSVHF